MADNIIQFPVPEVEEPYSTEYEAVLNAVDELTWDEREDLFCYLWFNGHAPVSY
jgi:hypothetical protein